MNIVVASDDNYVIHLLTLLVSIGENNKFNDIDFHVFDGGIHQESKNKIYVISKKYNNIKVYYYEMTEEKLDGMLGGSIKKDRSLLTFARIFIPNLINGDRAIYMDVDAIVKDDLNSLYNLELNGKAIGGVLDTNPISRHFNVGLTKQQIYINAGMILFDLKKCREIEFTKLCLDFIAQRKGEVDAMDQGTINGVLGSRNLIKVINPKYNVLTSFFQLNSKDIQKIYGLPSYYSDNEIENACKYPVFVHFTPNMTTRPWVKNCKHPLRNEYWKYRKSFDKDVFYDEDKRNLKARILGLVYRNLPSSLYCFFCNLRGWKK